MQQTCLVRIFDDAPRWYDPQQLSQFVPVKGELRWAARVGCNLLKDHVAWDVLGGAFRSVCCWYSRRTTCNLRLAPLL